MFEQQASKPFSQKDKAHCGFLADQHWDEKNEIPFWNVASNLALKQRARALICTRLYSEIEKEKSKCIRPITVQKKRVKNI